MLMRFSDVNTGLAVMDELRRRMDRLFDEYDARGNEGGPRFGALDPFFDVAPGRAVATWPRLSAYDNGAALVLTIEAPGLKESDFQIEINQDVLSITGERKPETLEGYAVHRRERTFTKFARSLALPFKVDSEQATAILKDGVLTLTLPKSPEARPKQITVKAKA